jgi:DNA-binding transcriptional regulator GbsR (MarR family)
MDKQSKPTSAAEAAQLATARDEFVTQWGTIGNAWGINRTMAQLHALLIITPRALTTDEVMEELKISRGNAHTNLRELVDWGLVRSVVRKGERKEYFEAEKVVWKMFCTIVRERKRREIRPAINVLKDCIERVEDLKSADARAFTAQTKSLCDFMEMADGVLSKIVRSEQSTIVPWALKFLK